MGAGVVRVRGGPRLRVVGEDVVEAGDGELVVGYRLLEADAYYSALGESIAPLLLVAEDPPGGPLGRLVEEYRARVVAEEILDLRHRLGPLTRLLEDRPLYYPLARMSRASKYYSCVFNEALRDAGWLEEEYGRLWESLSREGAYSLKDRIRRYMRRALSRARTPRTRLPGRLRGEYGSCSPSALLRQPWRLLSLRGSNAVVSTDCGWLSSIESRCSCSGAGLKSSTVICECGAARIALKNYYRMAWKWLLASPLAERYRFRLDPRHRLFNEYYWFTRLKGVVHAPRVYAVCGDHSSHAMAREYVGGERLVDVASEGAWEEAGRVLARIHDHGAALGDPNPENFIVRPGGIAVIDLEQAKPYTHELAAWDLSVVVAYSAAVYKRPWRLVDSLVKGYRDESGARWARVARILASPGFWAHSPPAALVAGRLRRYSSS